jgi:DNA-binding MarR family transcriptional regulator
MDGFDIEEIDDVIHGRVRLGIMAFLSGAGRAEFATLKSKLSLTDGNLSAHLTKLEGAGYVEIEKQFVGKKPLTTVLITPKGRKAFAQYLAAIGKLVESGGG